VSADTERIRAWRPAVAGVAEVLHARFVHYAYPPHVHDTWNVFIVNAGEIRYDLDRHHRGARPSMVGVLPPGVVHDGRPGGPGGYVKRVLYLERGVLGDELVGAAVDTSSVEDGALRAAIAALHDRLAAPDDALEAESRLAFAAERLARHLRRWPPAPGAPHDARLASVLREWLDARALEPVTLAEAGRELGASTTHLVRCFSGAYGIAPHAYVLGRRVDAARAQLLDGEPIARVAAAAGFFDQSHFSRHFKRHVGTTPGRFATRARMRPPSPRRAGTSRAPAAGTRRPRPA